MIQFSSLVPSEKGTVSWSCCSDVRQELRCGYGGGTALWRRCVQMHNAISYIAVAGAAKSIAGATGSPTTVAPQNNKPTFGLSVYRRRRRPASATAAVVSTPLPPGPWPPASARPERRQCRQAICHIKYWRSVSNLGEKRRDAAEWYERLPDGRRAARWGIAAGMMLFLLLEGRAPRTFLQRRSFV